eukprot:1776948-Amphidinium_carterae.1
MFSEHAVKDAMNKKLSQLINKRSFVEVDKRPSNNGTKDIKCKFCGQGFSPFIHDTETQTFAATSSSMAMRLLLTIAIIKKFTVLTTNAIIKKFTVLTTNVASAFLNTPISEEVLVQPPKEY